MVIKVMDTIFNKKVSAIKQINKLIADGAKIIDVGGESTRPGSKEILQTNDLPASGWIFENTGLGPDGREWFEAKKPFATPEDLQLLLNELTSSPKAFKDWEITSQVTKKNRDYAISGVVDLTDGFDLFTDEALNGLLEEPPLGIPIATLEESLG